MAMAKNANWTLSEDKILKYNLEKGAPLREIGIRLHKNERSIRLYCYRHFIPLRPQIKNPMMRRLLEIKFGKPEFFRPTKQFFEATRINQKRWADLQFGYAQPTQEELISTAKELHFSIEETFDLMDARQLDLFPQL
jgi:hypothetical protein